MIFRARSSIGLEHGASTSTVAGSSPAVRTIFLIAAVRKAVSAGVVSSAESRHPCRGALVKKAGKPVFMTILLAYQSPVLVPGFF